MLLTELISDSVTAAWVFPFDVVVWAHHPAATTFDAALVGDLHLSTSRFPISADWAEKQAGFAIAVCTDLGIHQVKVRLVLVDIIL
jgi:hypothetical protein